MTREEKGHFAKKHPPDRKVDPKIAEQVKSRASNEEIPCAAAFGIAKELNTTPEEVGFTIDSLEIHIAECQLGLFGHHPHGRIIKPADSVSPQLKEAIQSALENSRLSCAGVWGIARKLGLNKIDVASACEAQKIKIASCQLGTFR